MMDLLDDVSIIRNTCILDLLCNVRDKVIHSLQRPQPLPVHMIDLHKRGKNSI